MKHTTFFLIINLLIINFSNASITKGNSIKFDSWHNLTSLEYENQSIACQAEIKKYYWNQQKWPKENTAKKPKFSEVFSLAQMKVIRDQNLRKETMLYDLFDIEINDKLLQQELNRIAVSSSDQDKLTDLFNILNNDANNIIECLVRPSLVNHFIWENRNSQLIIDSNIKSFFKSQYIPSSDFQLIKKASINTNKNSKLKLPKQTRLAGASPEPRSTHTAIWTGNEMIIWGGRVSNSGWVYLNAGSKYNPILDSWSSLTSTNAPTGRYRHTAIWTGSEMIIWGGLNASNGYLDTGGKYNPLTDSWQNTSIMNGPSGRFKHSAVLAGSKMIVWGGVTSSGVTNTGSIYDTDLDNWTPTTLINSPLSRVNQSAVWTGSEMIIWGGDDSLTPRFSGAKYNLSNNEWADMSTSNSPSGKWSNSTIWTGTEMIVWGGIDDSLYSFNSGSKYNPELDSWTRTSLVSSPQARHDHTAIWTGTEMIIWGGQNVPELSPSPGEKLNSGAKYNPSSDSWTAITTTNTPSARYDHTAVWTGSQMIVWGGVDNTGYAVQGSRYTPASDSWLETENTESYTIGGNLSGLNGTVIIQNNKTDDLVLDANGSFTFNLQADGESYSVSVLTQPTLPNQTCIISNGTGTLAGENITNVVIECTTNSYLVGGFIDGLVSDNFVTLSMNQGDEFLVATDNVNFVFNDSITDGTGYNVTVQSQPTSPNQTCEVTNGSNTLMGDDVIDIEVNCLTNSYTIGGTVIGLENGNNLVLQNNQSDDLIVSDSGVFSFNTGVNDQTNYQVEVLNQPTNPIQNCQITNPTGTVNGTEINNVIILCDISTELIFRNSFD